MRFTGCGSERGQFAFLLPPGTYAFAVTSNLPKTIVADSMRDKELPHGDFLVHVVGDKRELDLGTIELVEKSN